MFRCFVDGFGNAEFEDTNGLSAHTYISPGC